MESGIANLLGMLSERVLELANAGKWEEAMRSADAVIEKARAANTGEFSDIISLATALEIKGDILRQQSYLEEARVVYLEALEMLNSREECNEMLARISASIGVLYDAVQNDEEAIVFYEHAIAMYERLDPPELTSVADICNNLGFIYRSLGNMDTAEALFVKGLEICHSAYGKNHEKTATLFNNVGALYLKLGSDAQAREMHTMALEGRLASLGDDHPDTAQSYSNLALTLVQVGENKEAKELFLKSLAIYEKHIKTESYEYASVAENYAEFLRASEDIKGSASVIKKAQKKLAKV
jgi:tetratricopeptide (TPR) repeat protein